MSAEFGNFAGRFPANVNRNRRDDEQGSHEDERHQPRWNVTDVERMVKRAQSFDRLVRMQEYFRYPRHHDEDENENVIPLQSAADCFQPADLEAGQNEILANQFFPFALEQLPVFHHHRNEKMRFEHADPCAKRVVKPVAPRFDPEHHPDNRQIEKENNVRHVPIGKRNGDDGGAAGDGPVRGNVEPLSPDHDPGQLAAVKMRHSVDVTRIVNAALQRNGCFLVSRGRALFRSHDSLR